MDESALAGQYQVLEELGSGSFGVVYKGIEKATGEIVAIKHIDLESSDDDIQDIQQEISVLSTCHSPFVTQYKTSFIRGYKLWIVMEYLGGGSCLDLLKPGPFSERHVAIVCRELLAGLTYLHKEGKIHRDVKAANVLLAHSGKVKLADFGVAAQLTNIKSQRNTFVGTPFWMAPEVIQEAGYDYKADIWSLGITALELIHGEPPHANIHPMKALFQIPKSPAPRLEGPDYSRDFKEFISACLVKDPDRRPPAKELLQHRFIRSAGQLDELQELIHRRQAMDDTNTLSAQPKYYEETMKALTTVQDKDDWVFDTVKAKTIVHPTVSVRKLPKNHEDPFIYDDKSETPEEMMGRLTITDQTPSTAEKYATAHRTTMKRRTSMTEISSPAKRRVSGQKQPLAPSTNFGNSPSTVRQFKRIPSNSRDPHQTQDSPRDENERPIVEPISKEGLLGRRAHSKVIDPACQELQAQTTGDEKREAIFQVARAMQQLSKVDSEGEYQLLRLILDKVQSDSRLSTLLPQSQPSSVQQPKLVLAQNNPHLKSHRRRQSSLLPVEQSPLDTKFVFPGQSVPGMEHTKQLADALYSKWADGLQNRWPKL